MNKKKWSGLLAGAMFAMASQTALAAEQLTILWAQWDPADYLQELVKDYEKQKLANQNTRQIASLNRQEIDAISEVLDSDIELATFLLIKLSLPAVFCRLTTGV